MCFRDHDQDDRSILSRILHPLDEETFLRESWARTPVVLRGAEPERFDGLFGAAEFDDYLFVARPPAGDISVVKDGRFPPLDMVSGLIGGRYDLQSIYDSFSAGYTVVLNAVHLRWPAARRLVLALEDRLLAEAQTNVYITGPNAQGFARHEDDHDVFVLQTQGAKRWIVYEKPLAGDNVVAMGEPRIVHDIELRRGDALYLPRGFPHEATTTGELSIHVSVGLFPLTWQQLAHESIDTAAGEETPWQRPVPLSAAIDAGVADSPVGDRLRSVLGPMGNVSALVETYRRRLTAGERRKNPPPSGYLNSLGTLGRIDVETEIERRPGVGCYLAVDARSATIHFMGETVRGPLSVAAAFRFIAATRRFRVGQIDDKLSAASQVVLVRRLIREGLLQRPDHKGGGPSTVA